VIVTRTARANPDVGRFEQPLLLAIEPSLNRRGLDLLCTARRGNEIFEEKNG
jgi:hypothetical protein